MNDQFRKGPEGRKRRGSRFPELDIPGPDRLIQGGSKEDFVSTVEAALRLVLRRLHVESRYPLVSSRIREHKAYRNLEATWEVLKPEVRAREWRRLTGLLVQTAYASRPYCLRCGECCLRESPSLHPEDARLITAGIISFEQLYTIRKGELVNFNLEGRVAVLEEELIKIRQEPQSGQCIFYRPQQRSCAIYQERPLQCRVQKCWDPQPFLKLWQQEKLSRRHLFAGHRGMLELIEAYDRRCDPGQIHSALGRYQKTGDSAALQPVADLLRYDAIFRSLLLERQKQLKGTLDLLLGRPLSQLLRPWGMRVERDAQGAFHLLPPH